MILVSRKWFQDFCLFSILIPEKSHTDPKLQVARIKPQLSYGILILDCVYCTVVLGYLFQSGEMFPFPGDGSDGEEGGGGLQIHLPWVTGGDEGVSYMLLNYPMLPTPFAWLSQLC